MVLSGPGLALCTLYTLYFGKFNVFLCHPEFLNSKYYGCAEWLKELNASQCAVVWNCMEFSIYSGTLNDISACELSRSKEHNVLRGSVEIDSN